MFDFSIIKRFKAHNFKKDFLSSGLATWKDIISLQRNKNMGSSEIFIIRGIYSPFLPSAWLSQPKTKKETPGGIEEESSENKYHTFIWIDSELEGG